MEHKNETLQNLVQRDYKALCRDLNLPLEDDVKKVLIPQSILGHAQNGHKVFTNYYKDLENLTMEDIFYALGEDPDKVRAYREKLIYEVKDCLDDLMEGRINQLINREGKPILGAQFLENLTISADKEIFKGIALAWRMDSDFWRQKTVDFYKTTLNGEKLEIGSGKEFLVNMDKLKEYGLTPKDLSQEEHSLERIQDYKSKQIIVEGALLPEIENVFIRGKKGLGCSDDACLISIGLIHGPDALLLGWAIDAVDTYTKFIQNPVEGGFDEWLGKHFENKWKEKYGEDLVTPKEIMEIIYLGAKQNHPLINLSSSHIRFNEIAENQELPTILNNHNYVGQRIKPQKYRLGFTRLFSSTFYRRLEERFEKYGKAHLIN